jgi:hypothetical protein
MAIQYAVNADGSLSLLGGVVVNVGTLWSVLPFTLGTDITSDSTSPFSPMYNPVLHILQLRGGLVLASTKATGYTLATIDLSGVSVSDKANWKPRSGVGLVPIGTSATAYRYHGTTILNATGVLQGQPDYPDTDTASIRAGTWTFNYQINLV